MSLDELTRVIGVDERTGALPYRIAFGKHDSIQIACGHARFIEHEHGSWKHTGTGGHGDCAPLKPGEMCVMGNKLTFRAPGHDPQIFIVTRYDADTQMWVAQWPD